VHFKFMLVLNIFSLSYVELFITSFTFTKTEFTIYMAWHTPEGDKLRLKTKLSILSPKSNTEY